jgi:hypothetical protein
MASDQAVSGRFGGNGTMLVSYAFGEEGCHGGEQAFVRAVELDRMVVSSSGVS